MKPLHYTARVILDLTPLPGLDGRPATGPLPGGVFAALHAASRQGAALGRAGALLTLSRAHLSRGETPQACTCADEALHLTRTHRLARPLRAPALLTASVTARVSGDHAAALALADAALRVRAADWPVHAHLARAATLRLSGEPWGALSAAHAAQEDTRTVSGEVAETLTWFAIDPAGTHARAAHLAGRLDGPLQARLAWHLAEHALAHGAQPEAEGWLRLAAAQPFAREEAALTPRAAAQAGVTLPAAEGSRAVQVLTLTRQGLQRGATFTPVPGDGRALALLTFLIHTGPAHWERAADAVLGGGERDALYAQVRHHLSSVRHLLRHPGAVTSRRGLLFLDPALDWQADALAPDARSARPWLPHVPGWWAEDRRARLHDGEERDRPPG